MIQPVCFLVSRCWVQHAQRLHGSTLPMPLHVLIDLLRAHSLRCKEVPQDQRGADLGCHTSLQKLRLHTSKGSLLVAPSVAFRTYSWISCKPGDHEISLVTPLISCESAVQAMD